MVWCGVVGYGIDPVTCALSCMAYALSSGHGIAGVLLLPDVALCSGWRAALRQSHANPSKQWCGWFSAHSCNTMGLGTASHSLHVMHNIKLMAVALSQHSISLPIQALMISAAQSNQTLKRWHALLSRASQLQASHGAMRHDRSVTRFPVTHQMSFPFRLV